MKNIINLLLLLSFSFLILSCSIQPSTPPSSPQVSTSTSIPQNTRPHLGTPISLPEPKNETIIQQPTPNLPQVPKYGESYFTKKFELPKTIKETSGLIKLDHALWTFNDSGGKAILYQIDEHTGKILKTVNIKNAKNKDWEDIAYDDNYVYIGDIGNNRGNRKDLKIYKIPRASLRTQKNINAEVINYHYADQKNFVSRPKQHNFDAEAMVAHNNKLYIFSKNWQNNQTRLYELSTQTGKQTAKNLSTFNIQGMVTAATLNKELNILLLTTYSSLLNVNVWAFSNYTNNDFFNGDKKQLNFTAPLQGQVEGITFINSYKAYMSSEAIKKFIFSFNASLYELDFSEEFE
ncbi:MAG: Unknown protein [uncultured Sulfurovum sp.]|uniref:Lipoprotein n=1 Tax=uncultured Sulfurovum sp. TaxID=269237 RepID=A0A6S6TC35_9BACT|nr:MAG: Unknown protein [uncultured Sulfurovum sp.]